MLGPGDVERAYADVSRARQLLGYRPSMEFIDGMRIFASWYLSEGGLQDGITEP
jgi:UDP-glucuronate 4-epimerase